MGTIVVKSDNTSPRIPGDADGVEAARREAKDTAEQARAIAGRIESYATQHGFENLEQFSKALNWERTHLRTVVKRLKTGSLRVSGGTLQELALHMGCTLDWLYNGTEPQTGTAARLHPGWSEAAAAAIARWGLDPAEVAAVGERWRIEEPLAPIEPDTVRDLVRLRNDAKGR